MRFRYVLLALLLSSASYADTLKLRSGRVVNGTYLGGTARQIRMDTGDRVETFDVGDVTSVQFTGSTSMSDMDQPQDRPRLRRADSRGDGNVMRPEPASAPPETARGPIELPAGTNFVVRMVDSVDSQQNRVGQTFNASLDEPVMVDGHTAIPRGADVLVKLVDDKESGKLTGHTELALDLSSVKIDGRMVDINTQSVTRSSEGRGQKTAKMATGGAALGAIIGAIAGGGKGAAIGAASGAGAGTAVQVATKGQRVHIPSETRLTFVLDSAVKI
jgi:hypothetical protein